MYQLNSNYILSESETITNPRWALADFQNDHPQSMNVDVYVLFESDSYVSTQKHVGNYDYTQAGTYEDSHLINFILSLPEFSQSTLIEE